VRGHGQQPTRPTSVRLMVWFLTGAVLAGCGGSVEPRRPDGPGVTGRMILLDDTGRPPTPASEGGILAIPEPALPDLWTRAGTQEPHRPEDLAYTSFALDGHVVAELGGEIVPVDDDGHFRLTSSGRHLICQTSDPDQSGAQISSTRGCDLIDLPDSGALKATFGEGGFHAELVPG
jgi:hypothetical protein